MKTTALPETEKVREYVRERYGAIAEQSDAACGCVATGCCGGSGQNYGEKLGYSADQLAAAPPGADLGLGCGNPLAIASIKPGEVVLDLGSGGGFDCFLAARQLAGTGRVIGVDMTAAMIGKARTNAAKSGLTNLEFRLGEIEALPVADASVDLIISNCVEAFRVLKPGGRLAIADVVATKPLPDDLREKLASIGACVGGATLIDELRRLLMGAGFGRIDIVLQEKSREYIRHWTDATEAGNFVVSALITAYKQ